MENIDNKTKLWEKIDIKWVIIIACVGFLVVFQVLPMLYLLVRSFISHGSFSLDNYRAVYTQSANWSALKNTFFSSLYSMFLSLTLAFPLAWLVGRTNLYNKKLFRTIFVTTYMIPPYVGAIAWSQLLNPRVGHLNVLFMKLFGLSEAPFNIYSMGGIVWVFTLFYYPYAFITISRAMEKMDPTLEEASKISGASPLKTIATITLPLMLPSILSAGLLVFVATSSAFGIPSIIGMPAKIDVLTTRIISATYVGTAEGISESTALAVSLMLIANAVLFFSTFVLGRRQYTTISGKSTRPNLVDLGKFRLPITILVWIFSIIAVFIPLISIVLTSLAQSISRPLGPGNISFDSWISVLKGNTYLNAFKNSLLTAGIAATVGTIISLLLAYLLVKTNVKGRHIPDFIITLGSSTPSIVIALALIMTMSGRFGINIYNTLTIIIIAFIIKYLMMAMRTIVSALSQVHISLEEAALNSGASWLRSFKDITLPLIAPSIVAGWFLIFMPCFYELSMTVLLYGAKTKTLGYLLYELQTYAEPQAASVLSVFILIVVLVSNTILNKVSKGDVGI